MREITYQSGLSVMGTTGWMFTNHWEPSCSADITVVVSEERYADEGGERVGEFLGQSPAVILRKRGSTPPQHVASAAQQLAHASRPPSADRSCAC